MKQLKVISKSAMRFSKMVVISAVLLSVAACSSNRSAVKQSSAPAGTAINLTSQSDARVSLRQVVDSYGRWDRLRVPVNINMTLPRRFSVSGTATMERDKSLLISLKFFGMEVAILYITDRKVMVVDKYNKKYIEEDIMDFVSGFPVTVSNLQDMLLGRVFLAGKSEIDANAFSKSDVDVISTTDWLLAPAAPAKGIEYGFRFSPADVLMALVVKVGEHRPFNLMYGLPVATDFGTFASDVAINYATSKSSLDLTLDWNFSKSRWNGDVELREPTVGSGYTRISRGDIMKMIPNL